MVEEPEARVTIYSSIYGIDCVTNCRSRIGDSETITLVSIRGHLHHLLRTAATRYIHSEGSWPRDNALITSRAIDLWKVEEVINLVGAEQGAVDLLERRSHSACVMQG